MSAGRQVAAYSVLAVCGVLVYQGYENAQPRPFTEQIALNVACDAGDGNCSVRDDRPREIRTSPVQRQYQFSTTSGPVMVTCRRDLIFFGAWKCSAEAGSFHPF